MKEAVMETQRLYFRQMTPQDHEALHRLFSDPVAMAHYPEPFTPEMTAGWIEWNMRNYRERGFGLWALIHKARQDVIGDCGLTLQKIDGAEELEIGYHLLPAYWRQGFATEAAVACRDYAFDSLGRDRVVAWMRVGNVASRRVAERVGMHLEKEAKDRHGEIQVVYSMRPADRERLSIPESRA
jgi:RimJ/RimL family protein N-acetyltransferase